MPLALLLGILGVTYGTVSTLILQHSYLAIFILLVLEAASLPIPSEVVLPVVGYLGATGKINLLLGFAVVILGGVVGMGIDYYIAYFFEKDVVYRHAEKFHIKKERLAAFDSWFVKNGNFAVFVARLLPVVRGFINFPAGFALMPIKQFYLYSILGTAIWDILLIGFGYYALSMSSMTLVIAAVFAFTVVLYAVYRYAMKRIR